MFVRNRLFFIGVVLAVVLVASGCEVTVIKRIIGEPPPGTEFEVEVDCTSTGDGSDTFTFTMDGDSDTYELPGSFNAGTCTVTETDDGGATNVSYQCVAEDPGTTCDPGGQTASVGSTSDGATITVTNEFVPTTTTTTPEAPATTAPPAAAPAQAGNVVAADPGFTG